MSISRILLFKRAVLITLSVSEARSLALHSQLLTGSVPLAGKAGVLQVLEKLGYVQIDTISVIRRAHHHVLWSRISDYRPALLRGLEEEDRAVFEYWAHAAAYLPMQDYRFSLPRKEAFLNGDAFWFEKDQKMANYVLDRIRSEGPLMSKDFENRSPRPAVSNGMDWARNPVNLALRQLFMEGRIMVSHRRGFQKTYDLPERILPGHIDTRMPSREAYLRHLIERDLRAHGLAKAREMGYLLKNTGREIRALLRKMVGEGQVLEGKVASLDGENYYLLPEALDGLQYPAGDAGLHLLSPFDNLVIQRKRLEELFGFRYVLECYVPAARRQFGYFSLPLLWGSRFAGQTDLKADRKTSILEVRNLAWEEGTLDQGELPALLALRLRDFAEFNGCREIAFSPAVPRKWAVSIKRHLQ